MLNDGVKNSALKITRLISMGLAMLVCALLPAVATTPEAAARRLDASPGRISTHFRVQTVGTPPSQRLEREVVQVLETWHHLFLVAFEHEPDGPIQVMLHSLNNFHRDTGAPHWANGVYTAQGTIHAAIGGVARVEADLERRLAHELAHAFITDLSAGEAPRWLQEGLAQAYSDLRPATAGNKPEITAATPADLGYSGTLAFARALLARLGQAALRDTLATMGSGHDVEAAFQAHTGATVAELFAHWRTAHSRVARRQNGESR